MEEIMSSDLKENVSNTNTWGRALFMILFGIIYSVAEVVLVAVIVIQFLFVLFTSEKNERLLGFGKELSTFIYQVFLYQTFNTEEKPFPFADWPKEAESESEAEAIETSASEPEPPKPPEEESKSPD
jgi:uncharacterized membrane protein YeiB